MHQRAAAPGWNAAPPGAAVDSSVGLSDCVVGSSCAYRGRRGASYRGRGVVAFGKKDKMQAVQTAGSRFYGTVALVLRSTYRLEAARSYEWPARGVYDRGWALDQQRVMAKACRASGWMSCGSGSSQKVRNPTCLNRSQPCRALLVQPAPAAMPTLLAGSVACCCKRQGSRTLRCVRMQTDCDGRGPEADGRCRRSKAPG